MIWIAAWNIERNAMAEMKAAESSGAFDYDPNYDPSTNSSFTKTSQQINAHYDPSTDNLIDISSEQLPPKERTPPLVKRKNSLDDFELEIEGITLDDNIDTSVCLNLYNLHGLKIDFVFVFYNFRTLI